MVMTRVMHLRQAKQSCHCIFRAHQVRLACLKVGRQLPKKYVPMLAILELVAQKGIQKPALGRTVLDALWWPRGLIRGIVIGIPTPRPAHTVPMPVLSVQ